VVPGQVEEQIRQALPGAYSLDFRLDPRPVARGNTGDTNAGSQPADTATGRRPDRPACQAAVDEVLAEGGIVFAFGSVELDPAARDLLDRVAARLLDCPGQQVEVGGHTDSAGDAEVNRRVSEARALAVTRYLVRAGVPEARLTAVGHGETRPVADNSTPDGRRQNRRIEFRVTE
jgi:OOP family OmpA-OmpF porin